MTLATDLARVPTLLSLARVPLGVAFIAVSDRPARALSVIAASGLTDVLDGWTARRMNQVTRVGTIVDPLTDKWFVACVIGALVARDRLPPLGVVALMTRELAEIPLALRELRRRADGDPHIETPMAVRAGKIATGLQFAAIASAVVDVKPVRDALLISTAIAGLFAGLAYWQRALTVESPA